MDGWGRSFESSRFAPQEKHYLAIVLPLYKLHKYSDGFAFLRKSHLAALTVHRTVIHSRSFESSRFVPQEKHYLAIVLPLYKLHKYSDGFAFLRKSHLAALTVHRTVIHSRSFESSRFCTTRKALSCDSAFLVVGEDGFEPSKSVTTDLQSAPFGRSGTLPGAGDGTRTRNLLITNQLLCQLSYTSIY